MIKATTKTLLSKEGIRFLIVGSVAFVVNFITLYLLHGALGLPLFISQVTSAEMTIFTSFILHHNWTYKKYSNRSIYIRYLHFNGTALGGTIISIGTVSFFVHVLKLNYLFGLGVGAFLALMWNYLSNKYFIWKKHAHIAA